MIHNRWVIGARGEAKSYADAIAEADRYPRPLPPMTAEEVEDFRPKLTTPAEDDRAR